MPIVNDVKKVYNATVIYEDGSSDTKEFLLDDLFENNVANVTIKIKGEIVVDYRKKEEEPVIGEILIKKQAV